MAGDWIKMRMDLPEDPAVFKLAAITGLDRLSIIGRLYAFWAWADKHAVDGRVDGATSQVVDDVVRFDGFANALVSVKWLEIGEDCIAMPHHDRHNGESAKERSLKNARQARWRAGKDAPVVAQPSTEPSTREEKRREEKIDQKKKAVAPLNRGSRINEDWQPTEADIAYAVSKSVDWKAEAENFKDFWMAKAGKDACKTRWDLTWKTWVRRSPKTTAASTPSPKSFGPKAAMQPSEDRLQHALSYAKQRYERGEFGTGTEAMAAYQAECQKQTQKHRSMQ